MRLDRNLYARETVMKALYRFHDEYVISYETEGAFIRVFFETSATIDSVEHEVAEIMKELSFQMIRLILPIGQRVYVNCLSLVHCMLRVLSLTVLCLNLMLQTHN